MRKIKLLVKFKFIGYKIITIKQDHILFKDKNNNIVCLMYSSIQELENSIKHILFNERMREINE
ncbi:hypothetical protein [Caviibacter abscessus]|uniref:hypothetical protein n=1 Tax=Caviibacter abscessus TaxID=1766719 RepID=UPI0008381E73|nr:hypothetical protein [Caviibacter abscessus]